MARNHEPGGDNDEPAGVEPEVTGIIQPDRYLGLEEVLAQRIKDLDAPELRGVTGLGLRSGDAAEIEANLRYRRLGMEAVLQNSRSLAEDRRKDAQRAIRARRRQSKAKE